MKLIIAIIKPFLAEKVIAAVMRLPVEEISVIESKGFGRQKNYLSRYEENEYSIAYLPKVEVNIWLDDCLVDEVVSVLLEHSRTGRMGDGKIMVMEAGSGLASQ